MRYSSVDIGTNSLILLILDLDSGEKRILDRPVITRLGEGLTETGFLSFSAMERTIRVLKEFKEILMKNEVVETIPFGTWALREAKNATEFLQWVEREVGFRVRVLSEEEEAFFNYFSVIGDPKLDFRDEVIVDIGGGSTEVILVEKGRIDCLRSIPVGAVKLKEQVLKNQPARDRDLSLAMDICDGVIKESLKRRRSELIGIGGTVTTLCAMVLDRGAFDFELIHGRKLSKEDVERIFSYIKNLSPSEIFTRFPHVGKRRADIILPGALILHRLMVFFGSNYIKVSAKGVRYGIIYWIAKGSQLNDEGLRYCKTQ